MFELQGSLFLHFLCTPSFSVNEGCAHLLHIMHSTFSVSFVNHVDEVPCPREASKRARRIKKKAPCCTGRRNGSMISIYKRSSELGTSVGLGAAE